MGWGGGGDVGGETVPIDREGVAVIVGGNVVVTTGKSSLMMIMSVTEGSSDTERSVFGDS